MTYLAQLSKLSAILISVAFTIFSLPKAYAASFDVEDPYICQNTVANFPEPYLTPENNREVLINGVREHCLDNYQASSEIVSELLNDLAGLSKKEITYAYVLQSINLNNIGSNDNCDLAKLAVAHGHGSDSKTLAIRAELNYFSFCELHDGNTSHTLKRLYELSKEALAMESFNLQLAIHNQISYVYYLLDQNQLAADELEIALELGKKMKSDDYLITLYNLIDAYLDAGELSLAEQRIELYHQSLTEKSSQWEQWLVLFAESYLSLLKEDYEKVLELKDKLGKGEPNDSPVFNEKIAIIQGLACFELGQFSCAESVINTHLMSTPIEDINRLKWLALLVKWYDYKGQYKEMRITQQRYFDLAEQKLFTQQQAAKILGVAKLNNEVIRLSSLELEQKLEQQQHTNRMYTLAITFLSVLLVVFVIGYWRLSVKIKKTVIVPQQER